MIDEKEHYECVKKLVEAFNRHGIDILLLGSSAVLYRFGNVRSTKDIDVHPFPTDPYEEFYDRLEEVAKELNGSFNIETDGASITFFATIGDKNITVELIDAGGSHFLTEEVLQNMTETSELIRGVHVPTNEHLIAAKAEAYMDRIEDDPNKEKFFDDLVGIREKLLEKDIKLDSSEIDRVVGLRVERKRDGLKRTISSQFSDIFE